MINKYLKIVPYLFQLILLTSIFGGIGYILAKYYFKITNENVVHLLFIGFEFLGVAIFAHMNRRVTLICLNYLKLNKKLLVLFLQNFLFISLAFSFISIVSYYLGIIRMREVIEINYLNMVLYFTLALAVAFCEEILFRGYIALYVDLIINKKTALFLSSLLFAISHVQYNSIFPFLTAVLAGLIFALLTFKYHSLLPAIAFHMGWNFSYFLFNDTFLVEIKMKVWGELFEIPQIMLLTFVLGYLIYPSRPKHVEPPTKKWTNV
jgi:membrane protease YdiL (CAAX protease family)